MKLPLITILSESEEFDERSNDREVEEFHVKVFMLRVPKSPSPGASIPLESVTFPRVPVPLRVAPVAFTVVVPALVMLELTIKFPALSAVVPVKLWLPLLLITRVPLPLLMRLALPLSVVPVPSTKRSRVDTLKVELPVTFTDPMVPFPPKAPPAKLKVAPVMLDRIVRFPAETVPVPT